MYSVLQCTAGARHTGQCTTYPIQCTPMYCGSTSHRSVYYIPDTVYSNVLREHVTQVSVLHTRYSVLQCTAGARHTGQCTTYPIQCTPMYCGSTSHRSVYYIPDTMYSNVLREHVTQVSVLHTRYSVLQCTAGARHTGQCNTYPVQCTPMYYGSTLLLLLLGRKE